MPNQNQTTGAATSEDWQGEADMMAEELPIALGIDQPQTTEDMIANEPASQFLRVEVPNRQMVLGMPIMVDATVDHGTIEIRSARGRVRIVNVGN